MRILAAWDNEAEAELISTYLGVDENEVTMTTSPAEFRSAIDDTFHKLLGERDEWVSSHNLTPSPA